MSDILGILSSNYVTVGGMTSYSKSKYVPVDPKKYEGTWTGKYPDNKAFKVTISQVQGYKARVKYESAGVVNYSQVLIRDDSFRIGDSKFVLMDQGQALIATIATDPATGTSMLKKATATLS